MGHAQNGGIHTVAWKGKKTVREFTALKMKTGRELTTQNGTSEQCYK